MNNAKKTKDILIRDVNLETILRLDQKASKMGLDRTAYLRMVLDNISLDSRINERTRILLEVLEINNDRLKKNNELCQLIIERLKDD